MAIEPTYSAFSGNRLVASGDLKTMLLRTKEYLSGGGTGTVLIFEDRTGRQFDFDFRGTPADVLARIPAHPLFAPSEPQIKAKIGPGRPRLGVISREVSLLPRHWEWLERQSGGISATLRRLVDKERKREDGKGLACVARDAAGRFMWAMAGDFPGFEEASRALYAKDLERLEDRIRDWPEDIRAHVQRLAGEAARLEDDNRDPMPPA